MAALDKVFKAYDVRGVYPEEIDEDLAWKVGHAAAQFLRSQLSGYERGQASTNRLVLGHDMRPSSEALVKAMIEGITSTGAGCFDIGMVDTPMVYFAINHLQACGGIQVTASHNPIQYNGFKVSGLKARPVGENSGLREVKHLVTTLRRMPISASLGQVTSADLWDAYRQHVLKFLKAPRRLKVVVDASNGMGGKMMPKVFEGINAEIIPLNFEIGKGFSHPPDPLIEANLADLRKAVLEHRADFGICLDGDADRCMFVDEAANIVRCDLMTALLARHFLKDNPGGMIVYDLRSSHAVPEEIRAAGGVPRRERVGHAFMKKALADGHGVFGGELSGHFYFRDNFNCDSGAIAFATALSVLSQQDHPLSKLIAPLARYATSGEINFSVSDKAGMMKELQEKYGKESRGVDQLDGVTIEFDDWWFNVRASNTEPLLRLNLEAKNKALMAQKVHELEQMLGKPVSH